MKNILIVAVLCLLVFSMFAAGVTISPGPAPNSGDGVSDGSGFADNPSQGIGPAPNSGDGIPDSSGF